MQNLDRVHKHAGVSKVTKSLSLCVVCVWVCTFRFVRTNKMTLTLWYGVCEVCLERDDTLHDFRPLDEETVTSHSYLSYHLQQEVMTSGCCVIVHKNTLMRTHTHRFPISRHSQCSAYQILASSCPAKVSQPAQEATYWKHLIRYGPDRTQGCSAYMPVMCSCCFSSLTGYMAL